MSIVLGLALRFWKPLAGLLLILVIIAALAGYRTHLINTGWDNALIVVKKKNADAAQAAAEAQATADACYTKGWYWSTVTGTCTEQER